MDSDQVLRMECQKIIEKWKPLLDLERYDIGVYILLYCELFDEKWDKGDNGDNAIGSHGEVHSWPKARVARIKILSEPEYNKVKFGENDFCQNDNYQLEHILVSAMCAIRSYEKFADYGSWYDSMDFLLIDLLIKVEKAKISVNQPKKKAA